MLCVTVTAYGSIAKQYYSSLDSIRKLNSLEGDDVKAGDRLIVVKCAGKN